MTSAQTDSLASLGDETHRVARGALVAATTTAVRLLSEGLGMSERVRVAIVDGGLTDFCMVRRIRAAGGDVL